MQPARLLEQGHSEAEVARRLGVYRQLEASESVTIICKSQ